MVHQGEAPEPGIGFVMVQVYDETRRRDQAGDLADPVPFPGIKNKADIRY